MNILEYTFLFLIFGTLRYFCLIVPAMEYVYIFYGKSHDATYCINIFNYKCQNHFENCYSNSNLTSSFSHTLMHFIAFLVLVYVALCVKCQSRDIWLISLRCNFLDLHFIYEKVTQIMDKFRRFNLL